MRGNWLRSSCAAVFLLASTVPLSGALADNNGGVAPQDVAPGSLGTNFGNAVCTAAINSDGTVAGGASVNKDPAQTAKISTGVYEVDFRNPCQDVRASRGFARYVQVDTLTDGTTGPITCQTANRAGDASSVWVQCYEVVGGAPADTSFFLTITR